MTLLPPPFLLREQGKWEAQQRPVTSGLAGKMPLRGSPLAFHVSARSPCPPTESESPAPQPCTTQSPLPLRSLPSQAYIRQLQDLGELGLWVQGF